MLNLSEINVSYLENHYSFFDTVFLGLTYSFPIALPLSPPLLICLRRIVVQGIRFGFASYLGTAIGYTFFFTLLLFGLRDFIQIWYDWEPLFYSIGLILSIKLLIAFYNEAPSDLVEQDMVKNYGIESTKSEHIPFLKYVVVGFINFLLVLCNPISLTAPSIFFFDPEISKLNSPGIFLFSFFIGFICFSFFFGFIFYFIRNNLGSYKNWQTASSNEEGNKLLVPITFKTFLLKFLNPFNKGLVITTLSILFMVTNEMTWNTLFQYPAENIFPAMKSASCSLPLNLDKFDGIRVFPDCDTNIENRDRQELVSRHFAVDSIAQQFLWEENPLPKAKYDLVYYRFHIHPLNKIQEAVRNFEIGQRTPLSQKTTPEQIKHLKEVKELYKQNNIPGYKTKYAARTVENTTKGISDYGYVKENSISQNVDYLNSSIKKNWSDSKITDFTIKSNTPTLLDFL
uniref:Hypothetical chloroplast RF1 n=1 Tax=Pyramimonas parkeae TaxID=36894 RepID=C0JX63_9CHLO|nr:hypothetical chloroplast RF1 [Pyramimonas parkeae]ACJ71141.1 hypothetical chloroplast RF1 [Pyramimonas parkeae]